MPNYKRVSKVIDRAIVVDFAFYFSIAMLGFFSSFDDTPPIVLERPNIESGKNIPILIAILLVVICVLVAFPMAYNPFR